MLTRKYEFKSIDSREPLEHIINVAFRNSRSTLVRDFKEESQFLAKLDDDFRHQLKAFKFVNFFETVHYGLRHDVVSAAEHIFSKSWLN